jgi:dihydrofolate reductase
MGKIVISENVTLDGVAQDPTGEEGFRHGGWGVRLADRDRADWARILLDEALAADALLLGRRSDEWFARRWASRTGAWADRLNSMPKYVASSAGHEPAWQNSTVLTGDVVGQISTLKRETAGEIVVYGSIQLARTLIAHDLADELRLIVFPIVLGTGERVFGETSDKKPARLVRAQPVGESLALLTYRLVRGYLGNQPT